MTDPTGPLAGGEPYYCQFCETGGEGQHDCPERAWSAAMGRYDMTTHGWAIGATMEPEEHGDWVTWDDARALLHVKEAESERLRELVSRAVPGIKAAGGSKAPDWLAEAARLIPTQEPTDAE